MYCTFLCLQSLYSDFFKKQIIYAGKCDPFFTSVGAEVLFFICWFATYCLFRDINNTLKRRQVQKANEVTNTQQALRHPELTLRVECIALPPNQLVAQPLTQLVTSTEPLVQATDQLSPTK